LIDQNVINQVNLTKDNSHNVTFKDYKHNIQIIGILIMNIVFL